MHATMFALSLIALILESSAVAGVPYKGESVRIVNGYPVVAAFLNGEGPFRMMVDTGTVRCSVRPSVAVRAGLHPSGTVLLATLVGEKTVPTARGWVGVGLREVSGAEIVINELPSLDGLEPRVDGLVAQNFLSLAPYFCLITGRDGFGSVMRPIEGGPARGLDPRRFSCGAGLPAGCH